MKNFPIIDIPLYLQKILYHIFQPSATTFSPAQPRYSTYPFCSSPAAARRPDEITMPLFPTLSTQPYPPRHAQPFLPLFLSYFYSLLRPFFSTIFSSQTLSNQYAAKRRSLPVARPLPLQRGALFQHPRPAFRPATTPYPHNDDLYKPICRQTPLVACGAATAPARRALPTFLTPFCPFPDPKFRHNHFNKSADKCGLPAFAPAPQGFPPLQKKHAPPPPRRRSPPR